MGRRQGNQSSRGRGAANAVPPRTRPDRVTYSGDVGSTMTTGEVPYYRVGKLNSKYGVVCARRAMMKAAMGLKTGLTGYGCAIGSYATISYPLSEEENLLYVLFCDLLCTLKFDVMGWSFAHVFA
jgi:hypothetical protein